MIRRLIDAWTAAAKLAAAQEDADQRLRLYARQCKKTQAAEDRAGVAEKRVVELEVQVAGLEEQVVELNDEARNRGADVRKLRGEVATLAEALDRSRDIAAGRASDLAEAQRELRRLRPPTGDPVATPRADLGEVTRLRDELARLQRFCAVQENRLARAEGRREVLVDG